MNNEIGIDSTGALVIPDESTAQMVETVASEVFGVNASIISIPSLGRTPLLNIPGKGIVPVRTKPLGTIQSKANAEEILRSCRILTIRRPQRLYHFRTWAAIAPVAGTTQVQFFQQIPANWLDGSFLDINVQEDWELLDIAGMVKMPRVVAAHTAPLTSATVDQLYDAIRGAFDGHLTVKRNSTEIVKRFELENLLPDLRIQVLQDDGTTYQVKVASRTKKHIAFADLFYGIRQPIVLRKDDRLYVDFTLRNPIALADVPAGPTAANEFRNNMMIGISFQGNHQEEEVVD